MNILFVSAEVSPFAKVGGLASVAGSLPVELRRLGHDVRIAMPLYGMIESDEAYDLHPLAKAMPVQSNGRWLDEARVKEGELDGVPVYFIGHDRFFKGATSSDKVYTPGIEQYLFFSAAVLELPNLLDWRVDVVHSNDWHTGFIPVIMREKLGNRFDATGAVFTIHNLAYQGEFGPEILDALALPRSLFVPEYLETWGGVNFLKAGCVYSEQVNTVSPSYAKEIQSPEFGCKLEGLMQHLAENGALSGILNGLGTDYFNPETDPYLPAQYSAGKPSGKATCKSKLLKEVGLIHQAGVPLIGVVTRLSSQKGVDLLIQAAPRLFEIPVQLVIQGLGDPVIIHELRRLEDEYPNHIRFIEKFDEDLAHRVYAGSDLFAMPSLFEPCGLGQMIALRYGTIPIVRSTGGLRDTVIEGVNGFVFAEKTPEDLASAVERAAAAYRKPAAWKKLITSGMSCDYGWRRSAQSYVALYELALEDRLMPDAKLA